MAPQAEPAECKSAGRLDGFLTLLEHVQHPRRGFYDLNEEEELPQFIQKMGKPNKTQREELEAFLDGVQMQNQFTDEKTAQVFLVLLENFHSRPQKLKGLSWPWSKFLEEQVRDEHNRKAAIAEVAGTGDRR